MPRIVREPQIYHVFERVRRQPDPAPLELWPVLIAPHKQVFDPFDATGTPIDTALMGTYDWPSHSKNVFVPSGYGSEYTQYDVPELLAGAKLEELDIWAVTGSGASQKVSKLRSSEDEVILASQANAVATLKPDGSLDGRTFTLTDSTVSFKRIFDLNPNIVFPSNDGQYSEGKWALVRIGNGKGGPFLVSAAPTSTNPYQITLRSLGYSPVYADQTVSYTLLTGAREFDFSAGPVKSSVEFAARSDAYSLTHLKLVQPGTRQVSVGGGHAAVLILSCEDPALYVDGYTLTLSDGTNPAVVFEIDDDGAIAGDVAVDITGIASAQEVATRLATAIAGNLTFDAFIDPTDSTKVIVRQLVAGLAGNTSATQNRAGSVANFFSGAFIPDAGVPDTAQFDGGSGDAGLTYTFKNVSDQPVQLTFNALTGIEALPLGAWTDAGGTYTASVTLPSAESSDVFTLNAVLSQDAEGGPRLYVEPSSIDTWLDPNNVEGRPTRSLSQLLAAGDPSAVDFGFGDAVGVITVPKATVRRIPLHIGLVDGFNPTDSLTVGFSKNDRGAVTSTEVIGSATVEIPCDAGTVPIGRPVGSQSPPLHEQFLESVNTALKSYYAGLGYDHVPDDLVRIAAHPDDQSYLIDDSTDWYALPVLSGLGIDGVVPSDLPQVYYNNGGSQEGLVSLVLTPTAPAGIATLEYRTAGAVGNGLNIGFLYKPNAGSAVSLSISNANGEFLITLPSDEKGNPTDVFLDDLAVLLDSKNVGGDFIYPIQLSKVIDPSTGDEVDAGDTDYSGWNTIRLAGFSLRETHSYTDSNGDTLTARLNRSDRADLFGGSDAGAVARLDNTLRGYGSLGSTNLYAEFVALRTDSSPSASLSVHGRSPDLVRVRSSDIESVVGKPDSRDPMSIIVSQYFSTANGSTAYIIGVDETTSEYPWGTQAAYDRVWDLLLRREGYHHFFFNDARWVRSWVVGKIRALGGELEDDGSVSFLQKAGYFYTPEKIPETAPDAKVAEGSDIQLVTDDGTTSIVNTGTNVVELGVQAGDILVSLGATLAGSVTLQDGTTGWPILSVDTASPTRFTLNATGLPANIFSTPGDPEPWQIIRPGASLRDSEGVFDAETAKDALVALHSVEGNFHRRLQKHVANSYTDLFEGQRLTLDGVYLLAQYAGIVARTKDEVPTSQARYGGSVEALQGIRSYFNDSQIEQVVGVGLTCAQQKVSPAGPVNVYRDVTSAIGSSDPDINTRTFQRRGSQVVEDLLVLRVNRRLRPRMAQALLTIQFLDSLSADVDSIMQYFRDNQLVREITLISIKVIDDAIRTEYGLDDTGLLIIWSYTHVEEAGAVIFRHVVNND